MKKNILLLTAILLISALTITYASGQKNSDTPTEKDMSQKEGKLGKKEFIQKAIATLDNNQQENLDKFFSKDLKWHKDGKEMTLDDLRQEKMFGKDRIIDKVILEGNKVGVHSSKNIDGTTFIYADFFHLEKGKIVKYWQFQQKEVPVAERKNEEGMLKGKSNVNLQTDPAQLEKNKELVRKFGEKAFGMGDAEFAESALKEGYIQHNPRVPTGKEAMVSMIGNIESFPNEVIDIIAEGDMVWAYISYPTFNTEVIDIFRIEDGKLAEHWDILNDNTFVTTE